MTRGNLDPRLAQRLSSNCTVLAKLGELTGRRYIRLAQFERAYQQRLREMELEAQRGIRWRLVGATILTRYPLILPDVHPSVEEYENFRLERNNYFSIDPEKNLELMEENLKGSGKQSKTAKKREKKEKEREEKKKGVTSDEKANTASQDLTEELFTTKEEEIQTETLEEVKARLEKMSPRITKDDELDNRKSLNRKLAQRLYLIVKKPRTEHAWQFPQGGREPGETMRQCCERELKEECGKKLRVYYGSNAPAAFYSYVYPKEAQEKYNAHGAKVFFYHAQYLGGSLELDKNELTDYLWVTKAEVEDYFSPEFNELAQKMLWE